MLTIKKEFAINISPRLLKLITRIKAKSLITAGLLFAAMAIFIQQSKAADFVGSFQCQQCHQQAFSDWQGSDHDMAMKHANKQSVVGDFANASLLYEGKQNLFFKKDNQYWVKIEDKKGQLSEFKISYTFGIDPLQQYMVEFDDGRVQLIPFAWDNRKQTEGGQKWFHLYPDNSSKHDDFFWQNVGQNWNFMCADCHSTNVQKNYDFNTNTFKTTFSEINVGCEACHGPASVHLDWSSQSTTKQQDNPNMGFKSVLTKSVIDWSWDHDETSATAPLNTALPANTKASDQLQTCAQCHSRRLQISDQNALVTDDFGDRYQLNLIGQELYFDDGQVYDENYVYGSFLQSKMHKAGVVCSNCHNPHSTKIVLPDNALCSQCHSPAKFDVTSHHQHQSDSAGAQCVNCHMPQTTYMQIDKRRDHSFSIPKPINSQRIGTPNACNQCHQDKSIEWAIEKTTAWYPTLNTIDSNHFSYAFAGARAPDPAAGDKLSYIAQDINQAAIIRAAALERLASYPGRNGIVAIARATRNDEPMLRLGAIQGSAPYSVADRWRMLEPLLTDNVLMVRSQAAAALAGFWPELTLQQQQALTKPLAEYVNILKFNGDRGFARTNLGHLYANQGNNKQAIAEYKASILIQANYAPAYINLADLYRSLGEEQLASSTLTQGINAQPDSGALQFSLALTLLRAKQSDSAITHLKLATELEPSNGRFWYVYGIAMTPISTSDAEKAFNEAYQVSGNPQYLYALCELMLSNKNPQAKQCLQRLSPQVPAEVTQQLKSRFAQ